MSTDQELQSLRNLGNEAEAAADEIARLRAIVACARYCRQTGVGGCVEIDGHDRPENGPCTPDNCKFMCSAPNAAQALQEANDIAGHYMAQRDELRKDAERLNWIERQYLEELSMRLVVDAEHDGSYCVCGDSNRPGYGPTLRAAIDAAMAPATTHPGAA